MRSRSLAVFVASLVLASCAPALTQAQRPVVPPVAPDSIPAWIYAPENLERNSPYSPGVFPRNIVLIGFPRGTTQVQRQATVDLIQGEVVGGDRAFGDDGFYLVRIKDDGTAGPLFEAIRKLKSLPFDLAALPEYLDRREDILADKPKTPPSQQ